VWDYTLTLAYGLVATGEAHVLVAVIGPEPDAARRQHAVAIDGLEIEAVGGRLEWMDGGQEATADVRTATARLAARWDADLVHVNGQLGLACLGDDSTFADEPPPVVLVLHSDVTTWWRWVKDGGGSASTLPDYLNWHRALAAHALECADAVVCPSRFLADEFTTSYGLSFRPPQVIYNAVTPPEPPVPAVARERDLAIVVGRVWDEAKNVALVAEALRRCTRPWRLEVAGDLAEPGRLPVTPPVAPRLSYRGFLDKPALSTLFHRAAIYIAASSYEPFGQTPAEAALAGCTVLANDIPVFRELWGDAARYFARNDAASLADRLDLLYDHQDDLAASAAAAAQRVRERYGVTQMVDAYLRLYRHLLQPSQLVTSIPTSQLWRR
jgi:glycosyltransferase involved in cell wall biosynthesis